MSYHRRPRPTCQRCARQVPRNPIGWNGIFKAGKITAYLCPECQTVDENIEAEINEATTEYSTDGSGALRGSPKEAA